MPTCITSTLRYSTSLPSFSTSLLENTSISVLPFPMTNPTAARSSLEVWYKRGAPDNPRNTWMLSS